MNALYYRDNLDVLRKDIRDESVDLIYLDPPFNSQATYNLLFRSTAGERSRAQIEAFEDTWQWGEEAELAFDGVLSGGNSEAAEMPRSIRSFLRENDMMAYLSRMAVRLLELRRVLQPSGSLYLHCDPTASHYLKILMDAIFGAENFRNEVIWKRTNARSTEGKWPRVHDALLFYSRATTFHFQSLKVPADRARLPHTLITVDGVKYQTYELTGAGATMRVKAGSHGRDLTLQNLAGIGRTARGNVMSGMPPRSFTGRRKKGRRRVPPQARCGSIQYRVKGNHGR